MATDEGWTRGDQIVAVEFHQGGHTSYGRQLYSFWVSMTVSGGDGSRTIRLWRTEGAVGEGVDMAVAALKLLELLGGPESGVVVYREGRVRLVPFSDAMLEAGALVKTDL